MSNDSYHAETETLSCSQLKVFIKSPLDYYEQFITGKMPKKESTRAMVLGTICHAVLLERKAIDAVCRAYPTSCLKSNGAINSVPAKEFEEKIFPLIAVKEDLLEQVESICDKARKGELGEILNSSFQFEKRIEAIVDGVPCRAKPDINDTASHANLIYDLKFSERCYPDDWWRTAKQMQYNIQDSHYSRIATASNGLPTIFRFFCLEINYPFRVKPYWYNSRSRELSDEFHSKKLGEFIECQEAGKWEDRWENEGTVGPWELGANDDGEMVTFDESDY